MSQPTKDNSLLSPINWTIAGSALAFSVMLATSALLFVLANVGLGPALGIVALVLVGFLAAMMLLVSNANAKKSPQIVVYTASLLMVAFIAIFTRTIGGPNSLVPLLLLVPVCYIALHRGRLATVIAAVLAGVVWLLLNLSVVLSDVRVALELSVSILPILVVGGLVQSLRTDTKRSTEHIAAIKAQDELTGVLNMRSFREFVDIEHQRAQRRSTNFAILLIDLDGLTEITQQHGRDISNQILIAAADAIKRSVRQEDRVARYGLNEFIVFLAYATDKSAREVANRICQNIYNMTLSLSRSTRRIEASTGLAFYPESGTSVKQLLRFAVEALQRERAFRQRKSDPDNDVRAQAGVDLS